LRSADCKRAGASPLLRRGMCGRPRLLLRMLPSRLGVGVVALDLALGAYPEDPSFLHFLLPCASCCLFPFPLPVSMCCVSPVCNGCALSVCAQAVSSCFAAAADADLLVFVSVSCSVDVCLCSCRISEGDSTQAINLRPSSRPNSSCTGEM
jgi:hypothetical protein